MADPDHPRELRLRRFRTAAYAVYLVVVVGFSLGIVINVFSSVRKMSPKRPPDVDQVLTVRECTDRLDGLWRRLDSQRKGFSRIHPAREADEKFTIFRVRWMRDLRDLEGRCAVDSRARRPLAVAFRSLEAVQDHYTIHATQYAGQVGPSVDRFVSALAEAKKIPKSD